MTERAMRTIVVEPGLDRMVRLLDGLAEQQVPTSAGTDSIVFLRAFVMTGIVAPTTADVLFFNPRRPRGRERQEETDSSRLLAYLQEEGFARQEPAEIIPNDPERVSPNGLVVVGTSPDLDLARSVGTPSLETGEPLVFNLEEGPFALRAVLDQAVLLKPLQ